MTCYAYHYTTVDNYEKIKTEGLLPHRIDKCQRIYGDVEGTWIFATSPDELAQLGVIAYVSSKQLCRMLVRLRVTLYESSFKDELALDEYGEPQFSDHAFEGSKSCPALLLIKPIPPWRLKLLDYLDVDQINEECLRQGFG